MEVGGQLHTPSALAAGKEPGTHWIGDWVGPRAGLDAMQNGKFPSLLWVIELPSSSLLPVPILTELPWLYLST